jgi:hypothetical protein
MKDFGFGRAQVTVLSMATSTGPSDSPMDQETACTSMLPHLKADGTTNRALLYTKPFVKPNPKIAKKSKTKFEFLGTRVILLTNTIYEKKKKNLFSISPECSI